MDEIKRVFASIAGLRSRHVGLYLLKNAANVCKVVYLVRTTPRSIAHEFLQEFDDELREVLGQVVGWRLDATQWEQAR